MAFMAEEMRVRMTQEERKERRKQDTKKAVVTLVSLICIVIIVVAGGIVLFQHFMPEQVADKPKDTETTETSETENTELPVVPVVPEVDPQTEQAQAFVAGMTLEQKVAQMFIITPDALTGVSGATRAGDATKSAYAEHPVGGLIYMSGNLKDTAQTQEMLANMMAYSQEITGLPLFLGVDEEGGSVSRIASNMEFGIADVGDMSEIGATGDPENARAVGNTLGGYLSELGFNMDFAPVADVITNPENQVVQYRSFGSDSELVSCMVVAELQGLQEQNVYGVVKHFPGHGGTAGDSHDGAAVTERTLDEMMASELVPFYGAINAGADFIMVGHISTPNITGNDIPSSLSEYMITELLRGQMGYQGIVVTDAMNMGAITGSYTSAEAAVAAVQAGVDIILMPEDYTAAYNGILEAVNNGTITEERINESVVRIVKVKQEMMQ